MRRGRRRRVDHVFDFCHRAHLDQLLDPGDPAPEHHDQHGSYRYGRAF
jgi:hypothetical protein